MRAHSLRVASACAYLSNRACMVYAHILTLHVTGLCVYVCIPAIADTRVHISRALWRVYVHACMRAYVGAYVHTNSK